jgi:hypothetical protein
VTSPDVQTLRDALKIGRDNHAVTGDCSAIWDLSLAALDRLVGELQRLRDAEERIERAWELCTWTSSTKSEIAATLLPGVPFSPPKYDVEERDSGVRQEPDVVEAIRLVNAAIDAGTIPPNRRGLPYTNWTRAADDVITPLYEALLEIAAVTTAEPSLELDRMTREWALERRAKEAAEARLRDTEHALQAIVEWDGFWADCCDSYPEMVEIAKAALPAAAAPPDRPREPGETGSGDAQSASVVEVGARTGSNSDTVYANESEYERIDRDRRECPHDSPLHELAPEDPGHFICSRCGKSFFTFERFHERGSALPDPDSSGGVVEEADE